MRLKIMTLLSLILLIGSLAAQSMFGAFKIVSDPKGATISLPGTNQVLGNTPSQIFPVFQDQYTSYTNGIPGRVFTILISKPGYQTIQQDIFVPFNCINQYQAIQNPTVFSFDLQRQYGPPPSYCPPPPPRPHPPTIWFNWNNWWNQPPHRPRPWQGHHNPPHYGGNNSGSHGGSHSGGNNGQNPPPGGPNNPPPPGGHGGHGNNPRP